MSDLYDKINADLKTAMISKDPDRVSVLKLLKSAILYAAVDSGNREQISDEKALAILKKESKKREEASALYAKAGDKQREQAEKYEKEVVDGYLPKMLSEQEVAAMVDRSLAQHTDIGPQVMGKVISEVKAESKGLADGALIAKLTKERINQ